MTSVTFGRIFLRRGPSILSFAKMNRFSTFHPMTTFRSYQDAIALLNGLQTGFETLNANRTRNQSLSIDEKRSRMKTRLQDTRKLLQKIGHEISDLNRLNVIHVAGTNGKGSTCAYIEQLLLLCHEKLGRPLRTALYTSPHLTSVCERFRINGVILSQEEFAKYFFQVYGKLCDAYEKAQFPGYFRFLTLLSFHIFLDKGIDATIMETGVGGEFDSTNIIQKPAATIITRISKDHQITLGEGLEDIAWHKAGIFKRGSPAVSVGQASPVSDILKMRAREKGVELRFLEVDRRLLASQLSPAQKTNASVALAGAELFLKNTYNLSGLPPGSIQSMQETVWPGRFQSIAVGPVEWYIDGAHNEEGLEIAADWFSARATGCHTLALVFNQESQRPTLDLLKRLHHRLCNVHGLHIKYAVFCTNTILKNENDGIDLLNLNKNAESLSTLTTQYKNAGLWSELESKSTVSVTRTIQEAIDSTKKACSGQPAKVLVTGSLHLVGGALSLIRASSVTR